MPNSGIKNINVQLIKNFIINTNEFMKFFGNSMLWFCIQKKTFHLRWFRTLYIPAKLNYMTGKLFNRTYNVFHNF